MRVLAVLMTVSMVSVPVFHQAGTRPTTLLPAQQQPVLTVTNTQDNGTGSFRTALNSAISAGGNRRIEFAIPQSDQGFDSRTGTWTIKPVRTYSITRNNITIDGASQSRNVADTNPNGPEIFFDAVDFRPTGQIEGNGLFEITGGDDNQIAGLAFVDSNPMKDGSFFGAVIISNHPFVTAGTTTRNKVIDNWFGLSPNGETQIQLRRGVTINFAGQENVVERNIFCAGLGILVSYFQPEGVPENHQSTINNVIRGNFFETNKTGTRRIPVSPAIRGDNLASCSIAITYGASNNTFENNIIGGNQSGGIGTLNVNTRFIGTSQNIIRHNRIGVGPNGEDIAPPLSDPVNARSVGIFAGAGDEVSGNIVAGFNTGILARATTPKGGDAGRTVLSGNTVRNCSIGIQAVQIEGADVVRNTIADCTRAGVVVADRQVDAARGLPGEFPNPFNFKTLGVTISQNRFEGIGGPGIALTDDAADVLGNTYSPNTRTSAAPSGPNYFQPSPSITRAERQTDGRILVTGTTSTGGKLELYASSRAARPGAPDTDVNAYGLGTFVMAAEVTGGSFNLTIPADMAAGLTDLTATLTNDGNTSEFARTAAVVGAPPPPDTEKPTVTVTAPAAGLTVESRAGASVAVAWTSSDNVGVASQSVKFTGKRNGQTFTETAATGLPGTTSSFTLNVRTDDAVADAQVVIEARDAAGNVGEGKSGLFTITVPVPADTQPPTVSNLLLNKKKVARKKDSTLIISWQSADNVGVKAHDVSFAPDGVNFTTTVAAGLPGDLKAFTWNVPDKATLPKTKTGVVRVTARDAAGNRGEALSAAFGLK